MKCNAPTVAYRRPGINPKTGKHYKPFRFFPFDRRLDSVNMSRLDKVQRCLREYKSCPPDAEPILLGCKRCLLCAQASRRQWAYRCVAESKMCGESMYLTLTVDEEHMQDVFPGYSLTHKPFQDFMKRLRMTLERGYWYDYVPPFTPQSSIVHLPCNLEKKFYQRSQIKYFMCGEYGELSMRPHYHCCVFGARFPDAFFAKKVGSNFYFSSPTLSRLWTYGKMSFFSDVTPQSAAYVAGYVDKKLSTTADDFRAVGLEPEYIKMSQGIGLSWFEKYKDYLYRFSSDGELFGEFFEVGRVPISAPRYFDEKYRLCDSDRFDKIVASRERRRFERLRIMSVDETINESGRKHAVLLARKHVREVRDCT